MEITAEKIMQQLSAGTQVAGVIAVFGEEGYYKDKIAPIVQYSPLLPPVGVWAVSQSQCGRSPSQVGY